MITHFQTVINMSSKVRQQILKPLSKDFQSSSSNRDAFLLSKAKELNMPIPEVCCSRHLQCLKNQGHSLDQSNENSSFSFNSELLTECFPVEISAEPIIQYQAKAEVDMLAQINIKKKAYQNLLKKCEQDIKREEIKNNLKKLSIEAKNAIKKHNNDEKGAFSPKSKWGHSLFAQDKKIKSEAHQFAGKQVQDKKGQQQIKKRQIKLKPIDQRIKEYQLQQMKKDQLERQQYSRKPKQINIKEVQSKIKDNANKILEEMKNQKIKKDQQKKIIQAKIRALQLKSLRNVKHSKKNPFTGTEEFNLGDSQYSTFSARANDRKLEKKKKKQKPKKPSGDNLSKTNKHNFLRKSSKSIIKTNSQNIKTQQLKPQIKDEQPVKEEPKGPFFIWNIPVYPNQIQKIEKNDDQVFMNIERFNHKSGKTFRQEANQYLTKKMEGKMTADKQLQKQQQFIKQVEAKKQILLQTFQNQQNLKLIDEKFWNEDEVFKPNILQNFHFYAK